MNDPERVTYTIDLHVTELLNLNQKLNRWQQAKRTAAIRNKAVAARLQDRAPRLDQATYTATIQFRDHRKRDGHNYTPTIEAAIDGLVSGPAGAIDWPHKLLPDTDSQHLTGQEPAIGWDGNLQPHYTRLILTFTSTGEAAA